MARRRPTRLTTGGMVAQQRPGRLSGPGLTPGLTVGPAPSVAPAPSAIAQYGAFTTAATGNAFLTSVSIFVPNVDVIAPPEGSQLYLAVFVVSLTDTITTPTDWTLVAGPIDTTGGGALRGYLFQRLAPTPGALTFNITKTGTGGTYRGICCAYTDGVFDAATSAAGAANSTTQTVPSVTTTAADCVLTILDGYRGASNTVTSVASGYDGDTGSASANTPNTQGADKGQAAAGASGATTQTLNLSATSVAFHISTKPG